MSEVRNPQKFRVEVCFSPEEFDLYKQEYESVVVIDVLRATSAICTAFEHGAESVIPVRNIEEALEYKEKGFIVGAERNGKVVEGFEFGNSPYDYMNENVKGQSIVLTTTNGTKAIHKAAKTHRVFIASFLNLQAVIDFLIREPQDVLLLASGWQGKFNLEDSICAGAISEALLESGKYESDEDSTIASLFLFKKAKRNYWGFLKASSHRRRLRNLNLNRDIKYCLTPNQTEIIPVYREGQLVKM